MVLLMIDVAWLVGMCVCGVTCLGFGFVDVVVWVDCWVCLVIVGF